MTNNLEDFAKHRDRNMVLLEVHAQTIWTAISKLPQDQTAAVDYATHAIWAAFNNMADLLKEALTSLNEDAAYESRLQARVSQLENEIVSLADSLQEYAGREDAIGDDAESYAYDQLISQIARTLDIKSKTANTLLELLTGNQPLSEDWKQAIREYAIRRKREATNANA